MNDKFEVGEEVAITNNFQMPKIGVVKRITPTGRIIANAKGTMGEWIFNPDGSCRGETMWSSTRIQKLTQPILDRIESYNLRVFINKIEWSKVSLASMRKIVNIIKEEGGTI